MADVFMPNDLNETLTIRDSARNSVPRRRILFYGIHLRCSYGRKIIGAGWIPKGVLYGDVTYDFCCGAVHMIYFSGSDGRTIVVGVAKYFLFISK